MMNEEMGGNAFWYGEGIRFNWINIYDFSSKFFSNANPL